MADAEIIPLGTRGRPGRGSGSSRPSAAARNLAGRANPRGTTATPAIPATEPTTEPPLAGPRLPTQQRAPQRKQHPTRPDHTDASHPAPPTGPPTTSGTTTRDRAPAAGRIPFGDFLGAFSTAAREVFGEGWEPRLAEFLAFLRRRVSGDYQVDEFGFDQEVTDRFFLAAVRPLAEKWFRVEARGVENIPTSGGALVVANHSGTVPLDGLVTGYTINAHTGRHLRPLGADLVFSLPVVSEMARKSGATLACNEDAERLLGNGELVGVWPEGFKGVGKPYSERYKLQRFGRGGFVSAAIRTGVPVVPCSVVGAEEIYPLVGNIPSLARLIGVPYIPITPFFPLLGPLGLVPLPSKWLIEFGEPIRTDSYDEGAADDPMLVFNLTDQVRETIQQTLYTLLMRRRSVFY